MFWKRPSLESLVAHSPIAVGRYLVEEAERQGFTLTPMKLLKIAYLAHGWMLGIHGLPLVRGPIEAWPYGPVFPELYKAVRHLGAATVTLADLPEGRPEVFEPEEESILKQSVSRYGSLSPARVSRITDARSSPWELTFRRGRRRPIPGELIRVHFGAMMRVYQQRLRAAEAEA